MLLRSSTGSSPSMFVVAVEQRLEDATCARHNCDFQAVSKRVWRGILVTLHWASGNFAKKAFRKKRSHANHGRKKAACETIVDVQSVSKKKRLGGLILLLTST